MGAKRFPAAGDVEFRWSGQVMEPVDSLAFIGRNPGDDDNVFIATGDSGNGMTHGTIAGLLLTDLILGRDNPWSELYDPSRKSVRALAEFAREAAASQVGYAGWVTGGDVASEKEIPLGRRRGRAPRAREDRRLPRRVRRVRRAVGGVSASRLHRRVEPHREDAGIARATDRASRRDGHVVNGPAVGDLAPAK